MCLQDLLQHEVQLDFQMLERRRLLLFRRMPVPPAQLSFCCTMFLFWLIRCTYLPLLDASREAMGGRAKNIASGKDVAKVLRGVGLEQLPDEKDYMIADLSKIVEKYEDFLWDVCRLTPRPTAPLLQKGYSLVLKGVSKADCKAFCQQLCNAIKDTRSKKSATSGKKLPPAVFRLLSVLRARIGETACSLSRSNEKKRVSEASGSGQAKALLPVSADQHSVSPKSKVLKAYGMSTNRSLQNLLVCFPSSKFFHPQSAWGSVLLRTLLLLRIRLLKRFLSRSITTVLCTIE